MSDRARFTFTDEITGAEFQWHGGAYIEIGYTAQADTGPFNNLGQPSFSAGQFVAGEVINVWDYANDRPTIERTLSAFEDKCRAYLNRCEDCGEDEDECTCDDDDDECEACGEDRTGGDDDFCASCLRDMASKRGEIE